MTFTDRLTFSPFFGGSILNGENSFNGSFLKIDKYEKAIVQLTDVYVKTAARQSKMTG